MNLLEQRDLPPLALMGTSLKEFGGYGIFSTPTSAPKGGALFSFLSQKGKRTFLLTLTPVEWKEGTIAPPPLIPQDAVLSVRNGWITFSLKGWGEAKIIPGDTELQRLLMAPRGQQVHALRASLSVTKRTLLLSLQEEDTDHAE